MTYPKNRKPRSAAVNVAAAKKGARSKALVRAARKLPYAPSQINPALVAISIAYIESGNAEFMGSVPATSPPGPEKK